MNHIKKITAAVLATVMVLISIPVTVHAAACSITFEVGTLYSGSTQVNVVDFGTIDLSTGELTAQKPIIIKGKSGEATIDMGIQSVTDQYGNIGPFRDEHYGAAWGMSYGLNQNGWVTNTIYMDVSYLPAGTYTEYFYIKPWEGSLDINNGAFQADSEGRYLIPVTVTLTGINPNFAAPVQNLQARAGNGAVELTWDEQTDRVDCEYTLYRMEGVPTGTPGQTSDPWEMIADEIRQAEPRYIDYGVENGKTYSYTAVVGSIGRGNCSEPAIATPSSSYVQRIEAIESFRVTDTVDGVEVFWNVLVPGQGQIREDIDHFNIYRNGVLYSCVDYSGYEEYWVESTTYGYQRDDYNQWDVILDTEPGVDYSWQMSAVDKDGIEGYLSQTLTACRIDTTPVIVKYQAVYDDSYQTPEDEENGTYRNAVRIYVNENSIYYGIKYIDVWRDGAYIGQLKGEEYNAGMWVYDMENIQPYKTYNYTIQVTDKQYQVSDPVTFYLTTDDEGVTYSLSPEFSIKNNNTLCLKLYGNEGCTYKLYRDGQEIAARQGEYEYFYFTDTPDTDGAYVYHVTETKNGRTLTSPDYTFIRNTVPETPEQKPSAPALSARIIEDGKVSLSWTPTQAGGSVDGYYIYKTRMNEGEEEYRTDMFYKSDGYWSGYYGSEPPQNRYIRLYADKRSFIDTQTSWWNEEWMPTKYWVCAYNQYGVSEPSEVIVYDYNEGDAPSNNNTEAPGKPTITNVWDAPDPSTHENYIDKLRNVYISWEGPSEGGREDYFEVVIEKKNSSGQYENEYFSEKDTDDRYLYCGEANLNPEYDGNNDVGSYRFTVVAVNTVNGVVNRTESDPYYYDLSYPPVLTLSGGTDFIDLTWTDATANVTAGDYEIWRKPEYGLWEKLAIGQTDISFDGTAFSCIDSTVTTGTTYSYYVLRNKGGVTRASREQTATPSAYMVLPGAPRNVSVKRMSGSNMLVSWDAPEDGGTPSRYNIQYFSSYDSSWYDLYDAKTSSTTYCGNINYDKIRVVAYNDAGAGPGSAEVDISELPENTASSYPPYVWPHEIIGDSTFTVTWDYNNYSEYNGVQYFQIVRSKNDGAQTLVDIVIADPSVTTYYWTDPDVENGNYYEYWVYPTNSYGYEHYSWGMSYSAFGIPQGPTLNSDQVAAGTVQDLIAGLPDAAAIDLADEETKALIREVQEVYEGLTDEQRRYIDPAIREKMDELIDTLDQADAEEKYENSQAVANAQALIDSLPYAESVTQIADAIIAQAAQARQAYASLPDDAKRVVNTEKLDALEQKISQLQRQAADIAAAENVIAAIDALPDPAQVTLDNASQVRAQLSNAQVLCNSLTPAQKDLMAQAAGGPAAIDKLAALDAAIEMLEVDEEDRIAAQAVIEMINTIPELTQLTAADEALVSQVRTALNNLTTKQRNMVPSELINKLASSEERMKLLKDADAVVQLIDQLPEAANVVIDDEAQIEAARLAYESLATQARAYVPAEALDKLEADEAAIEALYLAERQAADSVSQQIKGIPAPGALTLDDAAQVEAARAAYEALSAKAQALVPEADLQALKAAEEKIDALHMQAAADETSDTINDLPAPDAISFEDAAQIRAARAAYEALTDEEKALIPAEVLDKLETAEAALAEAMFNLEGWILDEGSWYYYESGVPLTGWQKLSGTWYYFNNTGVMQTGWVKSGGSWYYLKSSGAMATGWQKVDGSWYYLKSSGAMATGWYNDGGIWYYLKSSGAMAASEWCGGYWLNANGSWTYKPRGSWHKDSKGWWFGDTSGWYAKSTTQKIDGTNYTFNAAGYWVK